MLKIFVLRVLLYSAILGYTYTQDCTSGTADVVFVVDDSSTVQRTNYNLVLDFVAGIVGTLTVGPDAVQVSFLSFSGTVRNQFFLNDYSNTDAVVKKITSIRFRGGSTNIQKALQYAHDNNFDATRGARENVEKVLFLIADGESSGVETVSQEIRDDGIKILCLGITDEVSREFLETIAGDSLNVYYVDDFSDLAGIQDEMAAVLCEATNEPVTDPCDSQPCLNDGNCTTNGTYFTCACTSSYSGNTCDVVAEQPVNLEITDVTSRGFIISWDEPDRIYSVENYGYVIQITDDQSKCVKEIIYTCTDCIGRVQVANLRDMCSSNVRSEITKSKMELMGKLLYSANLDPDTLYNVTVTAITEAGRGHKAFKEERTLEEVPQAPYNVKVNEIGTTSFKVSWNIDGPRPGKTNFTVIVMADSPAATKEFMITGFTTRNFLSQGLEEYWNYSVTVTAATSVGAETSDKTRRYRTKSAAPGKVLNVKITEALGGIYKSMQISWRAPAILDQNSVIKEYSLITSSTRATAKKQSLLHESDENYEYKTVVNVIPDETYTFQVYATNIQDMQGEVITIEKQAPSGVPVNIEDTLKVDVITLNNVGERHLTLSIVQDIFEETTNGQVKASGLIACVTDCNFKGIKTLLDFNSMDNWKKASLKGFTLYRVTNPTWLDGINSRCSCGRRKRSVTKVEYTVGSDDCNDVSSDEYCNGPLQPGTSYHLVAVSCTNGGCLLSREYGPFVTASKEPCGIENESSTQSIIIGVVLGLVILILLVYAGYTTFLIRRCRQKDGKEINTAKNNNRNSQTYVNESFVVGVADAGGSTNAGTFRNESDTEYSRLDDNTREDRTTYDAIQSSRQY